MSYQNYCFRYLLDIAFHRTVALPFTHKKTPAEFVVVLLSLQRSERSITAVSADPWQMCWKWLRVGLG
jgi:hypothetical protein